MTGNDPDGPWAAGATRVNKFPHALAVIQELFAERRR